MLQTIQSGEELSPTAFSLSVHSAIAGLFSIAYGNNQEISVIAPGLEGIAPAFVEAVRDIGRGRGVGFNLAVRRTDRRILPGRAI